MNIVVNLFGVFAFALGMAEFSSMGLIDSFMTYLSIDKPQAGLLVTIYALGVVIGGPVLTVIFSTANIRRVILTTVFIFALSSLVVVFFKNFTFILIARFIGGAIHGIFFGMATTVIMQIVEKHKVNAATGQMFSGLSIAMVLGVPFVTVVSNYMDFRWAYVFVSVSSFFAFFAFLKYLPKDIKNEANRPTIPSMFKLFFNPFLLVIFAINVAGFGSSFVTYTYISPFLQETAHMSVTYVPFILLLYGLGSFLGMKQGGTLADRYGINKTLGFVLFATLFVVTLFSWFSTNVTATYFTMTLWGYCIFLFVSPIQGLALKTAQREQPKYVAIVSSLSISAFNLGITLGSLLGEGVVKYKTVADLPFYTLFMLALSMFFFIFHLQMNKSKSRI